MTEHEGRNTEIAARGTKTKASFLALPDSGEFGVIVRRWLRRSFFVSVAKVTLPLVALALALTLIVWLQLGIEARNVPEFGSRDLPSDMPDEISALRPRFLGWDKNGRALTITASLARQSAQRSNEYDLVAPKAGFGLTNGNRITLSANKGLYGEERGILSLSGNVTLFHDEGFEISTESAYVDVPGSFAYGNSAVQGKGPAGQITSEGFEVSKGGSIICFAGRASLTILPDGVESLVDNG